MALTVTAPAPSYSTPQPTPYAPPRLTVFDTGSESAPQGQLPGPAVFSVQEAKNATNPLQYVPVVGMIYRQATGETIPAPMSIAGSVVTSAIFGGPLGIVGSLVMNFATELFQMGPDLSRPAVPEGMSQTGSEAAMTPVTPGTTTEPGGYTTLATVLPDFLGGGDHTATAFAGEPGGNSVMASNASVSGTMSGMG